MAGSPPRSPAATDEAPDDDACLNLGDYAQQRLSGVRAFGGEGPRSARCVTDGQQAGATAHPVLDDAHGAVLLRHRRRQWRAQAGEERPRGGRRAGQATTRTATTAAYDAMVRMAQNFAQRYPLIDGQGNFGSPRRRRCGRHALHRSPPGAHWRACLLDEIDEGTVDYATQLRRQRTKSPSELLPARLPFVLLNGASGIAVGLATEVPSHNLREVAAASRRAAEKPEVAQRR